MRAVYGPRMFALTIPSSYHPLRQCTFCLQTESASPPRKMTTVQPPATPDVVRCRVLDGKMSTAAADEQPKTPARPSTLFKCIDDPPIASRGTPTTDERSQTNKLPSMPVICDLLSPVAPKPLLKQLSISPEIVCPKNSPGKDLIYDIFGTESESDDDTPSSSDNTESDGSDDPIIKLIEESIMSSPPPQPVEPNEKRYDSDEESPKPLTHPENLCAIFTPHLLTTTLGTSEEPPKPKPSPPSPKVYSCTVCQSKFSKISNYRRHYRHAHLDGKFKYMCESCPFESERRDNVVRHSKMTHTEATKHVALDVRPYDPKALANKPREQRPNEVLTEFQYKNQVKFRVVKGDKSPEPRLKKKPQLP